jgi:Bacterial PH domain
MIKWWSKWGSGGAETEWLRLAGFTRRNTRRAILKFLTYGLLPGERILHLTSGTYRLQMGFMAITDMRVVVGMSWAFLPFINRRRSVPLEAITWVRVDSNPWGGRLVVDSRQGTLRLGDIDEAEAERLASLIRRLSDRAKQRAATTAPPVVA